MHSVHQIEALSKIAEIIAFRSEEQKMLVDILDVRLMARRALDTAALQLDLGVSRRAGTGCRERIHQ